ncbi:MAG: hypothetical protein RLP44_07840 [Aggregatilineales bacterium]
MKKWMIVLSCISLFGAGLLISQNNNMPALAQEATPEATPEPVDCDPTALGATQAELASLLDDFGAMVETDDATRLEALGTLFTVGEEYQRIAFACGYVPDDINERTVGTDIDRIMEILADLRGDSVNGQALYNGEQVGADGVILGCSGCHSEATIAPITEGTWTRWDEIHSLEDQFADYNFERYTVESIVHPAAYIVPEYQNVMPPNFGDRISYQQLADLIAYLESQDQFLDD